MPTIPGSDGLLENCSAKSIASQIKYHHVKSYSWWWWKRTELCWNDEELKKVGISRTEAKAAFGNDRMYGKIH